MTARRWPAASLTAAFLAHALLLLYLTLGLSRVSRAVPIWVLVPTVGLLIVQLALDLGTGAETGGPRPTPRSYGVAWVRERLRRALDRETAGGSSARRALVAMGIVALLPALVLVAGFTLAVPAFAIVYLRTHCGESWKVTLAVTAVVSFMLAVVGRIGIGVAPYRGLVPAWLFG